MKRLLEADRQDASYLDHSRGPLTLSAADHSSPSAPFSSVRPGSVIALEVGPEKRRTTARIAPSVSGRRFVRERKSSWQGGSTRRVLASTDRVQLIVFNMSLALTGRYGKPNLNLNCRVAAPAAFDHFLLGPFQFGNL